MTLIFEINQNQILKRTKNKFRQNSVKILAYVIKMVLKLFDPKSKSSEIFSLNEISHNFKISFILNFSLNFLKSFLILFLYYLYILYIYYK